MTWLTYILVAVGLVLVASALIAIAVGLPKFKQQLDAHAREGEGD